MSTASKNPVGKLAARVAALIKRITSPAVSPPTVETLWEEEDYTAGPTHSDPIHDPWDPVDETAGDTRPPRTTGPSEPARQTGSVPNTCGEVTNDVPFSPDNCPTEDVVSLDDPDSFHSDINAPKEVDVDELDVDDADSAAWHDGLEDDSNEEIQAGVSEPFNAVDDPELDLSGWDDLDDYDPDARQLPWPIPPTHASRIAAEKAANVVRLMPLPRRTDQDAALRYLTDLFEHLPHPATYRALRGLARNLDIAEIEAMVSLREVWRDCDAWTGGFSWRLALRICRMRSEYTPDAMLDDDWFSEWRSLESRNRWFSAWVESRLRAQRARRLDEALRTHWGHEDPDDRPTSRRADQLIRGAIEN